MEKDFILNSRNFFYKKGYFKTKISEIASKTGVSIGSFYRVFNSKEELLIAVIKQELELYQKEAKLLNITDFNFRWKVNQLCHISLGLLKENPHLFILLYDVGKKREKLSPGVHKWIDMIWEESKGVFMKGIKEMIDVKKSDHLLIEALFENQFKIYFEYLLKDRSGALNPDSVVLMNLEEESKKLTSMIISSCESLNIIRKCSVYDPLTKAYTPAYIRKQVKTYLEQGQSFFVSFMVFRWPEDAEKEKVMFFKESILRSFVNLIKEEFRSEDAIGRLCQNKFILVLSFNPGVYPVDFSKRIKIVINLLNKKIPLFKPEFFRYSKTNILKAKDFDSEMKKLPQNTKML